ncbi:MAG: CsgG/HfaB family protein [Synergistaceae bacterium]|jgi:curli biogenesis system outer membrane secretion channel CsgG|nr:CsgG/HfaB family protein [Synergistaceae bacterium]
MAIRHTFRHIAALLLVFVLGASGAEAKPSLAVKAFADKSGECGEKVASAISDMLVNDLFEAGLFTILERERMDDVMDEILMGDTGFMDSSTAPEIGRLKSAKYTMTGSITVFHYNASGGVAYIPGIAGGGAAAKTAYVTLALRVIENETGEVVYSASQQGEAKREASGLITRFGGFATVSYGGILASAAQDSVSKHVARIQKTAWNE